MTDLSRRDHMGWRGSWSSLWVACPLCLNRAAGLQGSGGLAWLSLVVPRYLKALYASRQVNIFPLNHRIRIGWID